MTLENSVSKLSCVVSLSLVFKLVLKLRFKNLVQIKYQKLPFATSIEGNLNEIILQVSRVQGIMPRRKTV
jgi:uncharacterized protein YqgV (UPF0045/DUF77 family)